MKKILYLIACSFALISCVYARDCAYGLPSPKLYDNGWWTKGQTVKLKTTASSCLAKNISVYFDLGNYYFQLPRNVFVEGILMEDDEDPNEDDPVKRYYGSTEAGVWGMNWTMDGILDNGNIDSAGDQTCELYMKFRLTDVIAENPSEYYPDDAFRYTICID